MSNARVSTKFVWTATVVVALLATAPSLAAGGTSPSTASTLRLSEFAFDPLQGEPELPEGWRSPASAGPDLHLVQFDGPIPGGAMQSLREDGLEPIQYVYPNSYVVWGRTSDRHSLTGRPEIRWSGEFAPAYRVQPQWRELESDPVDVAVLIYRGAGVDTVVDSLSRLGGEPIHRTVVNDKFEVAGIRLPGDRMRLAAAVPGIYSIQLQAKDGGSRAEASAQINVGNLNSSGLPEPGYQGWLDLLGFDGSGVVVANVDEGVDGGHPDLAASMLPCAGPSCSAIPSIHGTHTAGIIAGDGSSAVLDSFGFLRGLGVAPGAGLIDQSYVPFNLVPGGALELMTDSVKNGASLSNNSWGFSSLALGYNVNTMLVDAGVRDADPLQPGNQPLTYVQAIDNGSGGTSSQGVPDEAKNIFAVGSTKALAVDASPQSDIDDISDNSAHGPSLDGRTLPHIVAPGCYVDSTYPDIGSGYEHHTRCGTSHAAPQVSGAVALFVEYYRGLPGYTSDPSPALVKAAFLPVAHDLEGNLDADGAVLGHRPDDKQGWGRLNLPAVIDPPPGSVLYIDQTRIFEESAEEWLREMMPVDPAEPMRIMLVWTDAPGHGLGGSTPAWNNDLDLVVEAEGNTYHGNDIGPDGYSQAGDVADPMNNAEGVFLELPPTLVTVRVVATNINSDGVPGYNDGTDQDFALVCYNCALTAGFALMPDPATQYVCAPDDTEFQVYIEQHSGYTEPVTLSLAGLPGDASAAFDVNPVAPAGSSVLTVSPGMSKSGDYQMELTGDTVDLSRSHPIYYRLRRAVPDTPVLTLPFQGAMNVFPQPVLEWDLLPWTEEYFVEVATDPDFENLVYTARTPALSHTVDMILDQGGSYYWRVRATNVCGFGEFSAISTFTTGHVPPVLLVDEHDETWFPPDIQGDYTGALDALGVSYDLWDVWALGTDQEPGYSTLAHYDSVIWFNGEEENYAGPNAFTEQALIHWFERKSGCFLVTGPDYLLSRGFSSFIQQYLGVASYIEDLGQSEVTGQGTVFGSDPPPPTLTLKTANPDYSDTVSPDETAELAFLGDIGDAAVNKDGSYYRTMFAGFGLERFNSGDLESTLATFLGWCDGLSELDGDADGVLNSVDCAPGDPDAWTSPSSVTDLVLNKATPEFSWTEPVSGGGAVYDVLRSLDYSDFWNATCVASGTPAPPYWGDDDPATPGQLFYYLVRTRSDCGTSSLGNNLDGTARHGTACD